MKRNLKKAIIKFLSYAIVLLMVGTIFCRPLAVYAEEPESEESLDEGEGGGVELETEETTEEISEETAGEESEGTGETTEELEEDSEIPVVYNKDYTSDAWMIHYDVSAHWEGGYNVEITIHNTQSEPIYCWFLKMDAEESSDNLWNASLSDYGNGCTIFTGKEWNQNITPNGEIKFGYTVEHSFISVPEACELYSLADSVVSGEYGVELVKSDIWENGYTGQITITNLSDEIIRNWSLEFDFGDEILEVWDGIKLSGEDGHYIITNAGYNCNIYPGDNVTIGFLAEGSAEGELTDAILHGYSMPDENTGEEDNPEEEGDPVLEGRTYTKETLEEDIIFDLENGAYYVRNQLTVSACLYTTKAEMDEVVSQIGAEVVGVISSISTFQIEFLEDKSYDELEEMADYLNGLDIVEFATFNYATPVIENYEPTDELYSCKDVWETEWEDVERDEPDVIIKNNPKADGEEDEDGGWNLAAPHGNNWGLEAMNVPGAWDYRDKFQGSVNVGIYDNMFGTHPDLEYSDDRREPINISKAHGTHVAGIIGATFDNGIGISGVATDVNIYRYPVVETTVSRSEALEELIKLDYVRVINVSYGYNNEIVYAATNKNVKAKRMVIKSAQELSVDLKKWIDEGYDFLIVCSAGNGRNKIYVEDDNEEYDYIEYKSKEISESKVGYIGNNDAFYNYDICAITAPEVKSRIIVVGAAGHEHVKEGKTSYYVSNYSNLGDRVDVYAPGDNILSTIPIEMDSEHPYATMSGTSMAAPYITGLAALIWQANPLLTAAQVKHIIMVNADIEVSWAQGAYMPDAKKCVETALNFSGGPKTYLDKIPSGTVKGKITDKNGKAMEGVNILVFQANWSKSNIDDNFYTTTTNREGIYELKLPKGSYSIVGYDPEENLPFFNLGAYVESGKECIVDYYDSNPLIHLSKDESYIYGVLTDATTGKGLPNVTAKLRYGWNNNYEPYLVDGDGKPIEAVSDEYGRIAIKVPRGKYTLEVRKSGYLIGFFNMITATNDYYWPNLRLTPELSENDYYLFMSWEDASIDLDAHLTYYESYNSTIEVRKMHVYSWDSQGVINGEIVASHEGNCLQDDCEVIILKASENLLKNGYFRYSVRNNTEKKNEGMELSYSGAMIRVYKGNYLKEIFYVPKGEIGNTWYAIKIGKEGVIGQDEFYSVYKDEVI